MIDYKNSLNEAQYEAVTAPDGPVLVVAGAGSGKTHTIVYRLAWLAEQGVPPHKMLLLTFTRKAARQMVTRVNNLLEGQYLTGVCGGTFHRFACDVLWDFRPAWLNGKTPRLIDETDIHRVISQCKEDLGLGKGDRAFPKVQTILSLFSAARNKEMALQDIIQSHETHLNNYTEELVRLEDEYHTQRRYNGYLDYDDLLFELEQTLKEHAELRTRFSHILVDEYQDTNCVQARIVRLLGNSGDGFGNVMAVGDEAQSIYAFRGANVRNILDFPKLFPGARVIKLEENYRSTQPILNVANALLRNAAEGFNKHLFTQKQGGPLVRLIKPLTAASQADIVVRRIRELLCEHTPSEIAVLFRANFHSYYLEMALKRAKIAFCKYGGLKYIESAHVKDILAYADIVATLQEQRAGESNAQLQALSIDRVAQLHRKIGKKTAKKLQDCAMKSKEALMEACAKHTELLHTLKFLQDLAEQDLEPEVCLQRIVEQYQPQLEKKYIDDWQRRQRELGEIVQMATTYTNIKKFIYDLMGDSAQDEEAQDLEQCITLSTVHSAKGLEWNAVIVLDLIDGFFPSYRAIQDADEYEEERRLLYVACTRARQNLDLCVPQMISSKQDGGSRYAKVSPFIQELSPDLFDRWKELHKGSLIRQNSSVRIEPAMSTAAYRVSAQEAAEGSQEGDYASEYDSQEVETTHTLYTKSIARTGQDGQQGKICRHALFGIGKICRMLSANKARVYFQGYGIKEVYVNNIKKEDEEEA